MMVGMTGVICCRGAAGVGAAGPAGAMPTARSAALEACFCVRIAQRVLLLRRSQRE